MSDYMKKIATAAVAAALVLAAMPIDARQTYQARVPNGANVPDHPGLGHVNLNGGGARNSFGLAFAAAGLTWTNTLCQADSDGDGFSNGAELGDPECVWTVGATPARTVAISDPSLSSSTPQTVSSASGMGTVAVPAAVAAVGVAAVLAA